MNKAESRLRELLDSVLSDTQTDEEASELRDLLDTHSELRPAVLEQLRTHSLLMWEHSPSAVGDAPVAPPVDDAAPTSVIARRGFRLATLAAAACLTMVLWSLYPSAPDAVAIGQIKPGDNLKLASATSAIGDEAALFPGLLEIDSGSLDIEFASGVEMNITGPARCEVVSGMLVRLDHGQATAQVPRWARGFTVETPDVGVVDLGTRFGVVRESDGKTDVVVFEGEVDLKSLHSTGVAPFERRLTQGEAARIDRNGDMERIFQVHGDWTGNGWSTNRRLGEEALIAAVWDNLWASKSVSYYQVIAGGLAEDAPAYVDQPHEWNGSDASGLPAFLRGADYVRTVNDFRYMGHLAIQIEFAADADLFVFFDRRSTLPDWLQEGYEDTGAEIGLDEDAWFGNPHFTVEAGAARSIDNVFSVWRRTCHAGEVVTLGSMNEGREARAMYGIAAKPR